MTPQMKNCAVLLQMIEQPVDTHEPVIFCNDGLQGWPSTFVGALRDEISDQYTALVRIELQ
jgi:hypothetical protein